MLTGPAMAIHFPMRVPNVKQIFVAFSDDINHLFSGCECWATPDEMGHKGEIIGKGERETRETVKQIKLNQRGGQRAWLCE